ncbi:hypothetical protein CC86DRAFT_381742 [Ophiobolus disseminans]|uniref:Uncharacterized protein n=1 Tax=Ophiobolus disseminans TaxID=1469910 RepID=A0A6A7A0K9_9PLEO|nr:hypothetical protein CC86DRAFT_381742 [Ophiobolus disseminans]
MVMVHSSIGCLYGPCITEENHCVNEVEGIRAEQKYPVEVASVFAMTKARVMQNALQGTGVLGRKKKKNLFLRMMLYQSIISIFLVAAIMLVNAQILERDGCTACPNGAIGADCTLDKKIASTGHVFICRFGECYEHVSCAANGTQCNEWDMAHMETQYFKKNRCEEKKICKDEKQEECMKETSCNVHDYNWKPHTCTGI